MGSFPYNQVHLGDGHFRLLLLLPSSSPEEPVTFSLVQVNKTNALRYIAVSYTWGAQPFDHSVFYYGQKEMKVTKSCSDVLTTLRGHGVQFVWIDQLCIDQSSPAEKIRQILLMNHIYAGASYVSIWLGTVPELYIWGSMHNLGLIEDEIPSASSVLSQGFIGVVPPSLASGDELAILHGVDMPMVVRRVDGGHYRLIGAAFILGWMRGEALGLESYSSTEITLV